MGLAERRALIEAIEKKRGSKLIAYVTSDRPGFAAQIAGDVVSIIHDHILGFNEAERSKLDLFLYSRGGHSDVPWALVSMFRQYCHRGSFSVLVPYRAHSAATVICLGADEILMTKKGELGPIDATMASGPYNPTEGNTPNRLPVSVEDVNGYFALLDRVGCERPSEKMEGFKEMTRRVHPLALGAVNRLLEETKLVGLRLLSTRAKPFTEEENHEIIKKLSSEVYSHSHAINRAEAVKYLGLKHVKDAETEELETPLWDLYLQYRELFQLETPFLPEEHLIANGLEEHSWDDLPFAIIESLGRVDTCKKTVRVRRLREIPPTLNINLTNLTLPPINLGNLQFPQPLDQQQLLQLVQQIVQACVQQSLNSAAQNAVINLIRSLPQKGFELVQLNSGWKIER
ncbi:MAG: hypothetical protein HY298_05045 [Verrucomicrobia bacterium]|nr:hypothetical protein [Verrucomicrobiota bacterium]